LKQGIANVKKSLLDVKEAEPIPHLPKRAPTPIPNPPSKADDILTRSLQDKLKNLTIKLQKAGKDKNMLEKQFDELREEKLKEVSDTFDIVLEIIGKSEGNKGGLAAAKKRRSKEPKKEVVKFAHEFNKVREQNRSYRLELQNIKRERTQEQIRKNKQMDELQVIIKKLKKNQNPNPVKKIDHIVTQEEMAQEKIVTDFKNKRVRSVAQIRRLQKRLDRAMGDLSERDKIITTLQKSRRQSIDRVKELESRIKGLNTELQSLRTQKIKVDMRKLEECRSNLISAQEKNEQLELEVMVTKERALKQLQFEYDKSKKKIAELLEELQTKEKRRTPAENERVVRKLRATNVELQEKLDQQEQKTLDLLCDNGALKFQFAAAETKISSLQRRIEQLDEYREFALQNGDVVKQEVKSKGKSSQSKTIMELERVAEALKRETYRLKRENETLKKIGPSNKKYMSVLNENKELRLEVKKLGTNNQRLQDAKDKAAYLENANKQIQKNLTKEIEVNLDLKKKINNLRNQISSLKRKIAEGKDENMKIHERLVQKMQSSQLGEKTTRVQLFEERKGIEAKNQLIKKLKEEIKVLMELSENQKSAARANTELTEEKTKKIKELQEELDKLKKDTNIISAENEALRKELGAFDISFFDEIEDLKFREKAASELIVELRVSNQNLRQRLTQYEDVE